MSDRIERVLIHPIEGDDLGMLPDVWRLWQEIPTTKVIADNNFTDLAITDYLSARDENGVHLVVSDLLVGGQTGLVCIASHLRECAQHERVQNGEVQLHLIAGATLGSLDKLEGVVRRIREDFQVTVLLE